MAATVTDNDVVVLGDAPAAALCAVRLAASKRRVVWVLPDAARGVEVELVRDLAGGPWLQPSFAATPALVRLLEGAGAIDACARLLSPTSPQLLDDRLRATLPDERKPGAAIDPALVDTSEALRELTRVPSTLGFLRRRALRRQVGALPSPDLSPERARDVFRVLGDVFDGFEPEVLPGKSSPFARGGTVRVLHAPHRLDGGAAAWLSILRDRAQALGVTIVKGALDGLVRTLEPGWSSVRVELAGKAAMQTRLVIDGLDRFSWGRAWAGAPDRLQRRLTTPPEPNGRGHLHAWRFVVAKRGLPVPLGPFAVVRAPFPLLLERRVGAKETDTLVAWTRLNPGDDGASLAPVLQARLAEVLPFFEKYVEARTALTPASHDPIAPWWPGGLPRRVLRATGVAPALDGWEGAAVLAEHLCDVAEARTPLETPKVRTA